MENYQYIIVKRIIDIIFSLLIIFIISPFVLLVCILIKASSRGPLIFRQIRVGLKGEEFMLYKFRSMVVDAEKESGPVLAQKNDTRVTPVGRILRRTRFDEIPQIVNILKGDMSLVGPRPERPYFVNRHKVLQGVRLSVKPGLTGLAQVQGAYLIHPKNKLRYDYLYINNKSILLDIKIILKTILIIFTRQGS